MFKRCQARFNHADVTSETEYKELYKESEKFVEYVKNRIKKEFRDLVKGL